MWMRFIWGGEHHTDEVHLGRAPHGGGSSEEESTTWTRFIWGGEHHTDEGSSGEVSTTQTRFIWEGEHHMDRVHLGRRAPCGRYSSGEESTTQKKFIREGQGEGSRPSRQLVANLSYQRRRMCDSSHLF